MAYCENPKTRNSGILCCIPQTGHCPNKCEDCFFQSGRSYLEPLKDNLPNMPTPEQVAHRVVRVNDGNDSNVNREEVMAATAQYPLRFYNTASPKDLDQFDGPVVLTLNPGPQTDQDFWRLHTIPPQLMFVRFRINIWNLPLARQAVAHYSAGEVPIVLTFMAYFNKGIPEEYAADYVFRKRTTNSYFAITTAAWLRVMDEFRLNQWVYSCGKIEGELGTTACRFCGNCLREFFAARERMEPRE